MRLSETLSLLRVTKPSAPYGVRRLARCYSIEDVARVARRRLPLGSRPYLDTGGEDEYTLRRNRAAFDRLEFLPRQPREVSNVDTSTTVLGQRIPLPFALSPIGAPARHRRRGGGSPRGAGGLGLAAAGEPGVRHCIDILAHELRMTMQLCGARSIAELDHGLIRQRQQVPDWDQERDSAGAARP